MEMGVEIPIGSPATHKALDVGAGIGIYAPWLLRCGYFYEAVDSSPWAVKYIEGAYGGPVHRVAFEDFPVGKLKYDIVISGHCLEHFHDARTALERMAMLLKPKGILLLVIPDNSDLLNPDHHWFFTQAGIERWLHDLQLCDIRTIEKQIVPREKFIYVAAKGKELCD
jgi:SAM-dependent methyltransferase